MVTFKDGCTPLQRRNKTSTYLSIKNICLDYPWRLSNSTYNILFVRVIFQVPFDLWVDPAKDLQESQTLF